MISGENVKAAKPENLTLIRMDCYGLGTCRRDPMCNREKGK
jgi:hypothetical protein